MTPAAPAPFSRAASYRRWQYVLLVVELGVLVLLYASLQSRAMIAIAVAHVFVLALVVMNDRTATAYQLALTEELLRDAEHRATTAEVRAFVLSRRLEDVERDLLARGEGRL